MRHFMILLIMLLSLSRFQQLKAQVQLPDSDSPDSASVAVFRDSLPRIIPDYLSPSIFIPRERLEGTLPWTYAPITRPVFPVHPTFGFNGSIGFGRYEINSPDRFFSSFASYNGIDVPQLYMTEQMMVGNTLRLSQGFYFLSGIMYGANMSVAANNWGMGTREGLIWNPTALLSVIFWTQYFQSVSVYSPVLFPDKHRDPAAIRMPATPEVFSFGVQANFTVGEFIIGVGTSVAPVPFQDRHHSEFRYR